MYQELCHVPPYVFPHGVSSVRRESDEQLTVASAAGLEWVPIFIEGCESVHTSLSHKTNRFQCRSCEQASKRVGIGKDRGLIQKRPLLWEVTTKFIHENPEERHTLGRAPNADGQSAASTQNARPFAQSGGRVWHKHQTELTHHCIECLVFERKRLPVHQE